MQILTIAGNVGNVKDIRTVGDDKVLNFSIAVDNGKDKNGEKREATWYDCALWGKRAESLAPYIAKGSKLALSGRPSARAPRGQGVSCPDGRGPDVHVVQVGRRALRTARRWRWR